MVIQIVEDDKTLSEGISISLGDFADSFHKEYKIADAKAGFDKYGSGYGSEEDDSEWEND